MCMQCKQISYKLHATNGMKQNANKDLRMKIKSSFSITIVAQALCADKQNKINIDQRTEDLLLF